MLTHDDLIARGKKWLSVSHDGKQLGYYQSRMGVILTEFVCYAGSIPDVIGFNDHISVLIECKISRADFKADLKKSHRNNRSQMGNYRYYLTPPDILTPDDIPDSWGLLVCGDKQIKVLKKAEFFNSFEVRNAEFPILYSIVRRAELRGLIPVLVKPLEVN